MIAATAEQRVERTDSVVFADTAAESQRRWAARPLRERLDILRSVRHAIAEKTSDLADAIAPDLARSKADTLVAEVLPLLEACRFLEREASSILKSRKLGLSGRPLWLSGVWAEVHREPIGHVLVIGPSNFPLFLPGTQVAAGTCGRKCRHVETGQRRRSRGKVDGVDFGTCRIAERRVTCHGRKRRCGTRSNQTRR